MSARIRSLFLLTILGAFALRFGQGAVEGEGEPSTGLSGHERWVSALAITPDGKQIVSGSEDDTLRVWDALTGKELRMVRVGGKGVTCLGISPDGKRVVSGSWDGVLRVWELGTGKELLTIRGHRENITAVAYSPDGKRLASGSGDDTLRVWDALTGKERLKFDSANEYDVTAVAFSPDGEHLVSGDGENALTVWDSRSGEELRILEGHSRSVSAVAFSRDGQRIASASHDGTVRVWDRQTGKELLNLTGHTEAVTAVAFSPDGRQILSGSEDKTLRLWDARTGEEQSVHRGNTDSVTAAAFSPDGRRLAWASGKVLRLRDAKPQDTFTSVVAPFFKQHCLSCHGARKQEGGVRLDGIDAVTAGNRDLWTMVHGKLSAGEMPPKDHPQPDGAEKNRFLQWIAQQQRALGSGGMRRLNRRELSASLRDLTGLEVDFSRSLPGDGTVAGFDTGADGLQEASDSVAQWLQVTRRAVDGLRFLDEPRGKIFSLNVREAKDARKAFDAWKADGVQGKASGIARPGVGLLIEPRSPGEREELSWAIPAPASREGVLRLTVVVSAMKLNDRIPNPRLWVRIGGADLDYREITGTLDRPQRLVYEAQLADLAIQAKGVTVALSNRVEIPYAVEGFENEDRTYPRDNPPGGSGLYRPAFDRKTLPPEKQPVPHIVLQQITIEPEACSPWPPAGWKANVGVIKDSTESAKRLLALWMERAWRRPVSEAEQAPFLKLYEKVRKEGRSFDEAVRSAFQSVLLSPPFRYQESPAHTDRVIAQHAIASRLSFMLVGGPPDAELRQLAASGKLREPAVLDAQVERLLADPRSDGFVRPFVTQWLELEQPITIAQAHINKVDFRFARYLKASMREETIAYVARMLADNRPARELVVSDWTMMNDTLAIHYGYPGIAGGTLRPVKLRADDPRGGGILGHAGIQSMLCWMGENWVIYRGAWALRHILNCPPPPPPLEVPELNPSDAKNRGKPFRELLKQHQQDSRCSVCHKNIDPVGFAFQNFDISGRWRDVEHESYKRGELDGRIAWVGVGPTRPVDTGGNLPRGEKFRTFAEFKQIVATSYQADMVRGIMKNFMVYATGRKPGIDEMTEIASIMKDHREAGYRLRDLLKAVVRSRAFLAPPEPQPSSGRKSP